MELMRDLKNISKDDVSLAGGKGASLGEMTKAGMPVPPGFVILSSAFEKFLEETDLNVEIDAILDSVNHKEIHTVENASEKIEALILQTEMPKDITEEIQKFFKNLNSKYVAVRSSATAEDSASAAWAGQLESYLNTTEDNLLENVKKCWASLFTPRAIFYRFEKNLHKQKISVAVVVQKMVESENSGIAFSVHPVTQDRNQLIIEAGLGLGEAIVSGQITPDSYVVEKNNQKILDKNINEQKKQLVRSKQGGNEWKNILGKKGKEQVLSDEDILKLAELILKIENHFSFPVDVEWAKEGEKFYILQSRPITTLGNKKNVNGKKLALGLFENYQRLFQVGAMPYIISDTFSEHYRTLKCLLVYSKNTWISFLPKSTIEETLNSGVEIFGDENLFNSYQKEFNEYKIISSEFFEKTVSQEKVSKEEVSKFLEFTAGLFIYYSKTEFFYTDKAFLGSANNPILKNSLVAMKQIKNSGREYLNRIFFGSESYLSRLLGIIGKQYDVDPKILSQYNRQEILSLFDDNKVAQSTTENRLKSYLMFSDGQNFTALDGDTAESIISSFLEHSHERGVEIKGISANTGIVKGKVKIILLGYDTFDQLKHEIDAMKQGEILVAETTSPEFIVACHKAGAIITNQGGLMSHAAIVSREMNIPCIVGTGNVTEILKNGDLVEVDAYNGIVRIIEKQDNFGGYKFFYESQGYNFLLEDIIITSYVSWPTVVLGLGNWVRKYVPEKVINKNKLKGLSHTKDEIDKKLKNIQQIIKELWEISLKDISQKRISGLFKNLANLLEHYSYFDTSYSEGIYAKDSKDSRAILIEQSKNVIRDDFDYIFFRENGLLEKLIKVISDFTKTDTDQIRWYRVNEIELLIGKGIRLKTSDIEARKKAYVFNKNNLNQISFFIGNEAMLFIKTFEENLKKEETNATLNGVVAHGRGKKVVGRVCIIHRDYSNHKKLIEDMETMEEKSILVTTTTDPEFMPAIKKSSAIITDIGGLLSHAAISARELDIPCVVGTENATKILKDGDLVEIDTNKGTVKIIERAK